MRGIASVRRLRTRQENDISKDDDISAARADLELQKLRLEIADLRRSPWLKPSVSIPIVAALATLALSQYLGIFEVERKRIEVQNREAQLTRNALSADLTKLNIERETLESGKKNLADQKAGLGADVTRLQNELTRLRGEAVAAKNAASKAQQQLKYTNTVLARPILGVSPQFIQQQKVARITVINRGRGPAKVNKLKLYVDGAQYPVGPINAPFAQTLVALGINFGWIRWELRQSSIESGDEWVMLSIIPEDYNEERAEQFRLATRRLGVEVCYCSSLGDCEWATFNRPVISAKECS